MLAFMKLKILGRKPTQVLVGLAGVLPVGALWGAAVDAEAEVSGTGVLFAGSALTGVAGVGTGVEDALAD